MFKIEKKHLKPATKAALLIGVLFGLSQVLLVNLFTSNEDPFNWSMLLMRSIGLGLIMGAVFILFPSVFSKSKS